MDYILAKKIKSKWYGIAGVNLGPKSCMAQANEIFFDKLGVNTWTEGHKTFWGDMFESQKNYGGRMKEFVDLTVI